MPNDLDPAAIRPQERSDLSEVSLLYRAKELAKSFRGDVPNRNEVRDMTANFGVELTTAILYQAILNSTRHGSYFRKINSMPPAELSPGAVARAREFEVTVVASQFLESGRVWGDHVEIWKKWARAMGFTTEDIRTDKSAALSANTREIAGFIRHVHHPKRIIVTYGQGGAEFHQILRRAGPELNSIVAWINVSGLINGSELCAMRTDSWLRRLGVAAKLARSQRHRLNYQELSATSAQMREPCVVPRGLRVVNIIGLPYRSEIPEGRNFSYMALERIEPNDGALLFSESLALPGQIVPVRMSHRAEDRLLEPVFKRVLASLISAN